jgi:hypothetical protein
MRFLELRNLLMTQHGWSRRVATLAARFDLGVDTQADWAAAEVGPYGRALLSRDEDWMILTH